MPRSVLIVDASLGNHALLQDYLGREDVICTAARGVEEGFDLAIELKPDIIIIDADLPDPKFTKAGKPTGGFDLCRRIKLTECLSHIPILLSFRASSSADKLIALELGAMGFLSRPYEAAAVIAQVRCALNVKRLADLLRQQAAVDPLTGLRTRDHYQQSLAGELSRVRRTPGCVSTILLRVDHFNRLKHEHGPTLADAILGTISRATEGVTRQGDVVSRLCDFTDGAQLAVICPDMTADQAEGQAERIRNAITMLRFEFHRSDFTVSVCLGVASVEVTEQDRPGSVWVPVDAMHAAAREALRRAGTLGPDHICTARIPVNPISEVLAA